MARNRLTRSGFTLIEMMVAMALSLGIMLILTESFKMALDFVRSANSTGEMISQLNGAGILLTRDLQADHFSNLDPAPNGPKLSDQRLDLPGWTPPPSGGFFRIVAPTVPGAPPAPVETTDPQGFNIYLPANPMTIPPSALNPTGGHALHFTSVFQTTDPGNNFTTTTLPDGTFYSSQCAEIAYFLSTMNKQTSVVGGQPLYNLIRRQRLVARDAGGQTSLAPGAGDPDVISVGGGTVNTMASIMNPTPGIRLTPLAQFPTSNNGRYGEDIVVSNVLSFEVKADWTPASPAAAFPGNTDAPYDYLSTAVAGGVFDTGATPPPSIRVKSLQIMIRIYDPRLKAARQNTWKFAM